MSGGNQDPLGDLLRQWAQRHAPAEADAERLQQRLAQAVRNDSFLDLPPAVVRPRRRAWGRHVWGWGLSFALGAAAAVAVLVALRAKDGQHIPESGPREVARETAGESPADDMPKSAYFAKSELADKAKLLAGMQELFGGRLAWVGEAGREVQLGLLPDAASAPRRSAPLAVRVVVLARQGGGSAWKLIWQADVIAQDEEVVDLAAESVPDGSLRLWMHALPDGAIAVDANLDWKGAASVQSAFSGIQRTGVPQRVFASQTEDAEYQVYQTVVPLEAKERS